jgi:PAS domain S-box-containing protein
LPVDPNQWERFVHPADRSLVDQVLGSALKTGQDTCEVEFRLRHKDGHYVPILLRGFILRDANGKPVRVSGTNIDMSERKQAEDLLRRSEKKLRNIINGTNAGTWEWNVQTGETIFDEKSVAILGYSLEEFQPISFEKWMQLKNPEDMQTSIELLEKHLQGKTDYYSFESKMKHKDGHWVWVLGQGIVVEWDNNGKPLWMSGMHIDITKRKRAEESLRESEKRYRTLVDTSPDAIIYISPGMQVILCNQRAADLYGVENPGQMLGMSAFNLFGPENNSWITENIARLPKGWSMRGQEFALSRKDGSLFPAEVGASLVVNEMDEPIGIISVVRDITLRKQMEQYLGRSERLTVMGQISAELAHEIKNPLQSIQSNLELMLDFALDPHEGQEHLRLCYTEIERLVELTNRLLNLSNPNKAYSQPVSVSDLFKRILALVEKSVREMGMNINLVVPDGFPPVLTDPDQMIQVLLNLSINAIEAMPRGGQLTLSAEAVDESVRLNVINDGNIIPANRLENIFELFYTTKSRGTGLGLPISFNIIQKMGGRLSAENLHDPDRVQFTITLPASTSGNEQEWSS